MLEAVLENDEEPLSNQAGANEDEDKDNDIPINGLEAEDRKTVKGLVTSITGRLTALRKKLQVISKRSSVPSIPSPSLGVRILYFFNTATHPFTDTVLRISINDRRAA